MKKATITYTAPAGESKTLEVAGWGVRRLTIEQGAEDPACFDRVRREVLGRAQHDSIGQAVLWRSAALPVRAARFQERGLLLGR